ncbi:MAG: pentapeptide repeat-containing protein [Thalassobaculaceae bacterium]
MKEAIIELWELSVKVFLEVRQYLVLWEPYGIALAVAGLAFTVYQVLIDIEDRQQDRAVREATLFVMAQERLDAARAAETVVDRGQARMLSEMADAGVALDGIDASGINLDRVELSFVILDGIDFRNSTFAGADLRGATFKGTAVDGATFEGANLSGAVFPWGEYRGGIFQGANISGGVFGPIWVELPATDAVINTAAIGAAGDYYYKHRDFGRKFPRRPTSFENAWYIENNPPLGLSDDVMETLIVCWSWVGSDRTFQPLPGLCEWPD